MTLPQPDRGEVWSVAFDPTIGREQAGSRPALVISVDKFNHGAAELVIVIPITSHDKKQPLHVRISPPEAGLSKTSFVKCEDVRSVSKERFKRRYGSVDAHTLAEVEARLRVLLNL